MFLSLVQLVLIRSDLFGSVLFGSWSIRVDSFQLQFFRIIEIWTQKIHVNFRFGFESSIFVSVSSRIFLYWFWFGFSG